ncbi:helix-turn-helix domain-containing protein [Paenibacillus gansuensis]|uniref:Helix-turn-helix domain-containing protein n=1 Tax=Paenibacillus gansuensis TaxID=306542 RepID=A0ABW5PJE2_9BACL
MKRDWLSSYRDQAGMTHEEVAIKANIKRQYYSMIENGNRNPSVDVAKRIGMVLNFNWIIFFDNKGNKMFPIAISSNV